MRRWHMRAADDFVVHPHPIIESPHRCAEGHQGPESARRALRPRNIHRGSDHHQHHDGELKHVSERGKGWSLQNPGAGQLHGAKGHKGDKPRMSTYELCAQGHKRPEGTRWPQLRGLYNESIPSLVITEVMRSPQKSKWVSRRGLPC